MLSQHSHDYGTLCWGALRICRALLPMFERQGSLELLEDHKLPCFVSSCIAPAISLMDAFAGEASLCVPQLEIFIFSTVSWIYNL